MNLNKIKQRSECCILLGRMNYPWKLTALCQNESILLKNLLALEESCVVNEFKSFHNENMATILQHEFALPRIMNLLETGIPAERIDELVKVMPIDEILAYDVEDVRAVLANEKIWDDCMDLFLRYYLRDNIEVDDLENLCNGLASFRSFREHLTDEWLGEMNEKRKIFVNPIFSDDFLSHLKEYDRWVQQLAEREDLRGLLEKLYGHTDGSLLLDDENMQELSMNTQRITDLLEWAESFFSEQQFPDFLELWMENHALTDDLEFLKRKVDAGNLVDVGSFLTGRAAYVAFLYNIMLPEGLSGVHEELVIFAIVKKKKAFVKLVHDNFDLYCSISGRSILFHRTFYEKCVNVNSLNKKNLEDCKTLLDMKGISWDLIVDRGYTFDEVALIYDLPEEYLQLYGYFSARRTDERLRIMREIVRKQCLSEDMDLANLSEMLIKKPMSRWMQCEFGHISGLTYENALRLLCEYRVLERLIPDMRSNAEVRCVLNNIEKIDNFPSLSDMYQHVVDYDEEWRSMADLFGYTKEFIADNKKRIIDFILRDGAHIIMAYYQTNEHKKDMLRRLVNAELLGRFKEMKYYRDDLVREIDYDITDGQKSTWMQNTQINAGELSIWEEDGLIPVMLMGEVPMYTCLSYISGVYNQCLLACHDSNKKILNMSYKGKIVLRAAIRLTKGTFHETEKKVDGPKLEFADLIAEKEKTDHDDHKKQEQLTLFVECAYIAGLPESMEKRACEMILKLMRQKAKNLSAQLVVSMSYQEYLKDTLIPAYYSIYISKSKAGEQYLDSMGGSNGIQREGSYTREKYLVDME